MRRIPYFRQQKDITCGPAVLRMAFAAFGKRYSEQKLADEAQPNSMDGTSHKNMVRVIRVHRFQAQEHTNATWADLHRLSRKNAVVMVNYVEPVDEEGHYAILAGITPTRITLQDPLHGKNFQLPKKEFMRRWHNERKTSFHWLLAITQKST